MANIFQHVLFTFLSNVGPLAFGLHLGWLGPFSLEMMGKGTKPTPYPTPLTSDQISWLGGLLSASMLIATPFYGLLLQNFSYKPLTIFTNAIHCIAFALYIVPNVNIAYAARFAGGFASVGSIVITPLYINECVAPSYRGFLGALTSLSITSGVAVAYVAGSYSTFMITNIVCICTALVFFLGVFWIPHSPIWLLMHQDVSGAEASLLKMRCATRHEAEQEIDAIKGELDENCAVQRAGLVTVVRDRGMRRALLLAMGMMVVQQATGITPMQFYYEMIIFENTSETPPAYVAPIIAAVQLMAAVFGALLLSHVGRKPLLLVTTLSITASYTAMWFILEFQHNHWILRFVCTLVYFASYNIGLGTVPFVMLPEILPQLARPVCVAVAGLLTGGVSFLYAKLFPNLIELYGLKFIILIFVVMSCLGVAFVLFCLFETKGKTSSEILQNLQGKKTAIADISISSNCPVLARVGTA